MLRMLSSALAIDGGGRALRTHANWTGRSAESEVGEACTGPMPSRGLPKKPWAKNQENTHVPFQPAFQIATTYSAATGTCGVQSDVASLVAGWTVKLRHHRVCLLLHLRVRCLLPCRCCCCCCLLDPVGPVVLPVEGLLRVKLVLQAVAVRRRGGSNSTHAQHVLVIKPHRAAALSAAVTHQPHPAAPTMTCGDATASLKCSLCSSSSMNRQCGNLQVAGAHTMAAAH